VPEQKKQPGLMVRHSERHAVSLRGSLAVSSRHAHLIRFSPSAGAAGGWVDVDVVDFGAGGVGIVTSHFVPRRAVVRLRIHADAPGEPPVLDGELRVQRVTMTDRKPTYLLGTAFENPAAGLDAQINDLVARLERRGAGAAPGA
jgi:hypothetical protein